MGVSSAAKACQSNGLYFRVSVYIGKLGQSPFQVGLEQYFVTFYL